MMNRQQRRAAGAPPSENHRVLVSKEGEYTRLTMIGMTSKVSSHVLLEPATAFKLGWALFKSGTKSWLTKRKS